jgi:hypothetical protein
MRSRDRVCALAGDQANDPFSASNVTLALPATRIYAENRAFAMALP